MCLTDGVAAAGQCRGFFVIHGHTRKGFAHVKGRTRRIGLAVHAFGIHVDETHLHGGQRVFHRVGFVEVAIAAVGRRQPFLFRAPVGIFLRVPDVFAAKGKTEGLEAHILVGQRARQQDQVGPGNLVAVFLLDRPQQTACLVEVAVVRPGVQRRKTDVSGAAAATAIGQTVRACGVPSEADHQTAVVTVVSGPPILAVLEEILHVGLERLDVEILERLTIVEPAKRIGLGVVLVQDVEVQRIWPPLHHVLPRGGIAAVHDRAFAAVVDIVSVHGILRS